ncbi:hypothetical protein DMC47_43620 [Nostoc sp. 3335mG]|nr:hypothetical protein DMC47_43620 [Nostoc sp. 3335mG]
MQFLVTVILNAGKAGGPPPQDLVNAEFEAVRGHYMDGVIRQIWLRADGSGGVMLVEADSAEIAAKTFSALPMVVAGVLGAPEVVPLAPYWGFAPRD